MTKTRRIPMAKAPSPMRWPLATLMLAVTLAACGGGGSEPQNVAATADATSSSRSGSLQALPSTVATQSLSAAEAASLAFMREEERLAHDVYAQSARRWPVLPIFANITESEATHTAAVKSLLDRYGLPDPLAGLPEGSFSTPAFQMLYDELVAISDLGLIEALTVGVQIEELDIHDIEAQKAVVDNEDILRVYEQLLRGSRNHLRAYMEALLLRGGSYVPQYISQEEFDAILAGPRETGP